MSTKNMMRRGPVVGALALLIAAPAWAAKPEPAKSDKAASSMDEADGATEPEATKAAPSAPEALPQIGEDSLAVFVLQRGFYVATDLGMFFSLGGVNGYSNMQPYLALHAGYDLNDWISVQASVSGGYVAGNPISANDDPNQTVAGQAVTNYDLIGIGAEVLAAYRPSPRFALEPKFGGGVTRISPAPTDPNDVAAVLSTMNPHVSFGLDLKYLTLLTDFTAGVSATGYYVIGPNVLALGTSFALRYTF